ncbi:class I SAM-dependent methyltransferase [Mesorhizobium sp. YR577]|uniref:O-methyltransferase n=1 Tax=Mesorhizobium sp. YR577 TaxID=1884373 RepID=UPI0008F2EF47|nr:class I SAM-dependent methyltransferase [Mesorhizobium sp. YR577]SFU15481.1 Predicted O-methyltransferase YrrM [Mesorhizobium sp. YR577]
MRSPIFHRMFDYDRQLLPNRHLAFLETGVGAIDEARDQTGATIGYPGWGLIYYILLSHLDRDRYELIVETGTNWGSTTIVLAQALVDARCRGKVVTFELEPENVAKAKANLSAAGVADRVEVVQGDSRVNVPAVLKERCEPKSVRFAFLDASHLEADMLAEFESVFPYLADDAIVVFDNTYCIAMPNEDQRVNGALKKFPKLYGGNLINFEFVSWFTPGMAIWQKAPKL